jgi:rubredoxin
MGAHLIDGEFQSDKYPTTPRGKVPLSTKDPTAHDLLWEYAQRRRSVDAEFSEDLEQALRNAGYTPKAPIPMILTCPACSERHIDEGEFATTKIHHTHACQNCGVVWRPAIVPTVGVQFLPGFRNG